MTSRVYCAWFLGLIAACAVCVALPCAAQEGKNTAAGKRQVLGDPKFERGFTLTGATHDAPKRVETWKKQDGSADAQKPVWRIAQWNSRGTLDRVNVGEKKITLTDDFKSVTIDRKTGSVNLTAATSRDYEKPRTSGSQPWVHLLIEQSPFENPIKITSAQHIWAEIDFELTEFAEHGKNDPGLHAAQLSWFIYLKNTTPDSKGVGDFLWFGISLFDNRHDFVPLYAAQDFAMPNGDFIYTLGSKSYLKERVTVGKRHSVRIDILPEIERAIKAAQEKGFMLQSTADAMSFDGMNLGWEIPGTFDVGVTIHKLSLEVEP